MKAVEIKLETARSNYDSSIRDFQSRMDHYLKLVREIAEKSESAASKTVNDISKHRSDVDRLMEEVRLRCATAEKNTWNSEAQVKEVKTAVLDFVNGFNDVIATKKMVTSNQEQAEKKMADIENLLSNRVASLECTLERIEGECANSFALIGEEIKRLVMAITSLQGHVKDLKDGIDLSQMDANNAQLRAVNNEKQVNLIEKKIENLYLMIKKVGLDSQE